jgi:hypothetical protein
MKSKLSIAPLAHPLIGLILLTVLTPTSSLAQPKTDADYFTYYGTNRRSQTCPSRSEPKTGRLNVAQALKYTHCWFEDNSRTVALADISNFRLSAPRQVTEKDSLQQWTINNIDRTQPMYDIKARVVLYFCSKINRDPSTNPNYFGTPGKNCQLIGSVERDPLNSTGICFKDLTEQWHCRLTVKGKPIYGPPPTK